MPERSMNAAHQGAPADVAKSTDASLAAADNLASAARPVVTVWAGMATASGIRWSGGASGGTRRATWNSANCHRQIHSQWGWQCRGQRLTKPRLLANSRARVLRAWIRCASRLKLSRRPLAGRDTFLRGNLHVWFRGGREPQGRSCYPTGRPTQQRGWASAV